jgi:arylsulfatase A-like enzyme
MDVEMSITRREAIAASLAAPAVLRGAASPRKAGDKPNLLFLWTDEQRADTLAVHGNTRFRVPVLNRLAAESVVLDRAYVTQPVCTPSRSCVMTGTLPHANGCVNNNVALKKETPCLPELLDDAAYRAAYIGKWHLGDEVFAQHGFEHWVSMEDGYHQYFSKGRDESAKSSYHHFLARLGYRPGDNGRYSRGFAVRLPIEHCKPAFLAAEASKFILDKSAKGEPWISYVNFLEPHMPFFGPYNDLHSETEAPVPANYPGDQLKNEPEKYRKSRAKYLADGFDGEDLKTRAGWQRLNRNYAGLCTQVDQAVGRILWALETSGQAENTIVVFTSDHGEMMGAHSLIGKGVMYEEAMRVPWMMRAPFLRMKPRLAPGAYSQVDLVPTLLDMLGHKEKAEGLPGRSLVPLLASGARPQTPVISEWNAAQNEANARTIISQDGWKLVEHDKDHGMLFDRNRDPLEANNLYGESAGQARQKALRTQLEQVLRTRKDPFQLPS